MSSFNLPKFKLSKSFVIGILVLLFIGANIWLYFYGPSQLGTNVLYQKFLTLFQQKQSIEESAVYKLPTGKQEYTGQYGSAAIGPKIQKAYIDPLDVKKGKKQTVTLLLKNESPVTSATATLITDHRNVPGTFKLVNGTATNGTWQLTWTMDDTYDTTYQIYITLESSTGNWQGALTFL